MYLYNIDIEKHRRDNLINQKGIRMVTVGKGLRTKGLGWGRLSWIMKDKLLKLGSIAQDSELTICHVSNNIILDVHYCDTFIINIYIFFIGTVQ